MSLTHLSLAIEVGSDPIQGSILTGDQESRTFRGWVELASAIEAAHTSTPDARPGLDLEKE